MNFNLYSTDDLRNLYAKGDERVVPIPEIKAEILRRLWWKTVITNTVLAAIGIIAIGSVVIRHL